MRDSIVDFIVYWVERAEIPACRLRGWLGLTAGKYANWQNRYGKVNEHNGLIPRDFWIEKWEQQRIIDFYKTNPHEGVHPTFMECVSRLRSKIFS
ncbi:hypothetical protein [Desulfogranum marinum]|uniref:hypothetical protein n=1 Tax=Desulfogranum marinum TaxID=453220 RepID=UPI001965F02A|nr:hypothetical protein [Desulfogranum marinum]MBM9513706.1 hypothetical protein [Desulfogranum marinum]